MVIRKEKMVDVIKFNERKQWSVRCLVVGMIDEIFGCLAWPGKGVLRNPVLKSGVSPRVALCCEVVTIHKYGTVMGPFQSSCLMRRPMECC